MSTVTVYGSRLDGKRTEAYFDGTGTSSASIPPRLFGNPSTRAG